MDGRGQHAAFDYSSLTKKDKKHILIKHCQRTDVWPSVIITKDDFPFIIISSPMLVLLAVTINKLILFFSVPYAGGLFQLDVKLHSDVQRHQSKGCAANDNLSWDCRAPAGSQMCSGTLLQGGWWSAPQGTQPTAVTATTVCLPDLHI